MHGRRVKLSGENIHLRVIHAFEAIDQGSTRQSNFAGVSFDFGMCATQSNRHIVIDDQCFAFRIPGFLNDIVLRLTGIIP